MSELYIGFKLALQTVSTRGATGMADGRPPPPHAPARLHAARGAHQTFLDRRAAPGLHLSLALASLLARRCVATRVTTV